MLPCGAIEVFKVCVEWLYRTSPSEFVIPYHKYLKSLDNNLTAGCRFKMKFESEESSERKCDTHLFFIKIVLCLPWLVDVQECGMNRMGC